MLPGPGMIMCDSCGEWFHMRCVGISQTQAKATKKYLCPVCAAVRVSELPSEGRSGWPAASHLGHRTLLCWGMRAVLPEAPAQRRRLEQPTNGTPQYDGEPLQAALAKLKKTRRPMRAGLGAFLEQASDGRV